MARRVICTCSDSCAATWRLRLRLCQLGFMTQRTLLGQFMSQIGDLALHLSTHLKHFTAQGSNIV